MAGGTSGCRVPCASSRCLDAAVQMFSVNGYHETSMDVIATEAQISKPMLYLYYGSKEELFGACLSRELSRFIEAVGADIDIKAPHDLLRSTILSVLRYIDANRRPGSCCTRRPPVRRPSRTPSGRAGEDHRHGGPAAEEGTRNPEPDTDFHMMAVAGGRRRGRRDASQHRRRGRRRGRQLLINLFWRGLKGSPAERETHSITS